MPSIISFVFHPAIAIKFIASADSVALYFVSLPICLAFSFNASKSLPVAPETAETLLIADSKSALVFTTAVPIPITGVVTVFIIVVPTDDNCLPTPCILSPILVTIFLTVLFASDCAVLKFLKNPVISKSRYPTAEPASIAIFYPPFFCFILLFN